MATAIQPANGDGVGAPWWPLLRAKYVKAVPKQVRRFFEEYSGQAACEPTKAARLVGYRFPNVQGPKLVKKFPDVTEAAKVVFLERCGVKPDELLMHMGEIIRNKEERTQDRLKAIELNAKVHGMLSEKVIHEFDRGKLLKQIDERIMQLTQARALETGNVIDAEVVDGKDVGDLT